MKTLKMLSVVILAIMCGAALLVALGALGVFGPTFILQRGIAVLGIILAILAFVQMMKIMASLV